MIRLVDSELRRFAARRLVRWLSGLTVAGIALAGAIVFARSDPGAPTAFGGRSPGFDYRSVVEILIGLSPVMLILTWMWGASFVGAEWHTRSMTTSLTWEPRRIRLFMAKAAAAAFASLVVVAVLGALLAGALAPAAALRGTFGPSPGDRVAEVAATLARVSALGAVGAAIGLGIAAVGRNTAFAIGAGFVHLAVAENLVRAFRPGWARWLVGDNVALFVTADAASFGGRGPAEAGILLAAYGAAVVAIAAVSFRVRDVS